MNRALHLRKTLKGRHGLLQPLACHRHAHHPDGHPKNQHEACQHRASASSRRLWRRLWEARHHSRPETKRSQPILAQAPARSSGTLSGQLSMEILSGKRLHACRVAGADTSTCKNGGLHPSRSSACAFLEWGSAANMRPSTSRLGRKRGVGFGDCS